MRCAVVGDPIDHSLSPQMHLAAFDHTGITGTFDRMRVPLDSFSEVVDALRNGRLDAVSVTMPHKSNAFLSADVRSPEAERCGAVNTLVRDDRGLHGYNTDVAGVRHAFTILSLPDDVPVRILGAGGAARAAAVAFEGHPTSVSARRPEEAHALIESIESDGVMADWAEAEPGCVLVNATPIGMQGERLPLHLLDGFEGVIDMAYGGAETPLVQLARDRGIPVADGIDMLAGQAVEAFRRFTGVRVPVEVFEQAARHR